jgi:hypothetical protein
MRAKISIAILVGAAAVALASPVASPGPPKPKPMDDNKDVGDNVGKVGRCPVCLTSLFEMVMVTNNPTD